MRKRCFFRRGRSDPTRKPLSARQSPYECKFKSPRPYDRCEMADRVPSMFGGRSGATPLRLQRQARQNLTATQKKSRRDAGVTNAGVFPRCGSVAFAAGCAASLRGNRSGLGSAPTTANSKAHARAAGVKLQTGCQACLTGVAVLRPYDCKSRSRRRGGRSFVASD